MASDLIVIELHGLGPALTRALAITPEIRREQRKRVEQALQVGIESVRGQIRGRRATNPEEVLGIVTGNLRGSIGNRRHEWGIREIKPTATGFEARAGTSSPYGPVHEYGGVINVFGISQTLLPARPFFQPGIAAARPVIDKIMGEPITLGIFRGR